MAGEFAGLRPAAAAVRAARAVGSGAGSPPAVRVADPRTLRTAVSLASVCDAVTSTPALSTATWISSLVETAPGATAE